MNSYVVNYPYALTPFENNNVDILQKDTAEKSALVDLSERRPLGEQYILDDSGRRSSNLPLELHSCNSVVENSSSETELSDTESVHQAMSLSSPEDSPHPEAEGDKNAVSKFVTDVERRPPLIVCNSQPTETSPPSQEEEDDDDEDSNSKDSGEKTDKRHSTSSDSSDCSDYVTSCSLRGPSRHDVRKAERLIIDLMSTPKHLARTPEESDEQYARRVRKHNYLSLAQEFAARNRGEKQTPVDEVPEICQTLPSSLRRGPSVTCGNIEDFKPVSQFTISEDSREWAKNMKNTAKCLTTSSQQHDNRRPVNFEVKDTSRPLLSVSSLINAPSSNQNAIHRHHQRSLAKYDACLAKDHDGSREHWTTQTHKFKPLNLKLSSGLTTDRNSESANKSKNSIYSDLPANVAKMVRNSLPPVSGSTSCKSNKATCETYLQRTASRTNCLSGLPTPHHHPENIHNAPSSHLSSHNNESNYKNTKVPSPPQEILGGFDVYNIETAMPTIDWAAMEEHLTKAAKEEVFFHKYHLNNREEIRRKLAMDSDNDDFYGGERAVRKPSLQSRLQSGMNLQICFMNETVSDQEAALSDHDAEQTLKMAHHPPSYEKSKNREAIAPENDPVSVFKKSSEVPQVDETTDFISKQAKLQAEARLALAQAKQMAHMQMEIEKQRKKKSPIAEMVGIPFPDGRHKLSRQALSEMNLAQLQVIVNDLHTQIENLNEELVRLLLERDDLHMEQDSMLVDIEDLTRYL